MHVCTLVDKAAQYVDTLRIDETGVPNEITWNGRLFVLTSQVNKQQTWLFVERG